jgi:hypothetical protein
MSGGGNASVAERRCIYSGNPLVPGDERLKPSHEHIVPLALGGSNQFTTDDVCAAANARAGNEIDDEVARLLPFVMLRRRFGLKGNRRTIPNIKLKGEFAEIPDAVVTLEVDPDANISARVCNEQRVEGKVVSLGSTEERVRFLLNARLRQARQRGLNILTPFGQIADEEDIEIALLLADRTPGREFKAPFTINLRAFHFAVVRLMTKIALGLGHRVFGPRWTFGAGGDLLRQGLWLAPKSGTLPRIQGCLTDRVEHVLAPVLGIAPDKHVMAVLPVGTDTAAIIALFGGACGVATIFLGIDSRAFFDGDGEEEAGACLFEIPMAGDVAQRRVRSRTLLEIADDAARSGLLGRG